MAVLSDSDRLFVWRAFMRLNTEACPFTKVALRAALDATDQWIDDNSTAFNTALPAGAGSFRATASLQQKTLLFCFVAMRRAGLLTSEGA